MTPSPVPDYYELLQVSPRADRDTIERVFRLLAKRHHPDNPEGGDADRFTALLEAFRVLSEPESRARYDVRHEAELQARWRVFGTGAHDIDPASDRLMQRAILSILYRACREDPDHPGLGMVKLEHLLGCAQEQIKYHLWYLKERGWIRRTESGTLAITVAGVDEVMEQGGPAHGGLHLLKAAGDAANEPAVPHAATG